MLTVEIRVQGCLDEEWSQWLGDLDIIYTPENETILSGSLPDQAALLGLIARMRDLGLQMTYVHSEEQA
ncbi:MAG: hypothetical protein P8Z00_25230 [Anaerolineales bacterium]|jgi:hypothetical protein